jgi:hypothetical protein
VDSVHESSPLEYASNGSTASSADSNAIDIPFPLIGAIIVNASPILHSAAAGSSRGLKESPPIEHAESGIHSAVASRRRRIVESTLVNLSIADLALPPLP